MYQLLSIEPAIATTDDMITLEGTFAASATVHFPGGVAQAATVLGEHRATVVVPAAATAGDLTITTGDVTIGPLPFRRTSFALGLQQFRASYEQADGGRQGASLATARSAFTPVVVGGWLHVLGGTDGSNALNSIERAPINADGTIGSFDPAADLTLATARSGHTSVVIGPSLYVIGGTGSSGTLDSVEQATINPDGSLGSFAVIPNATLAMARTGHTSTIIGNSIYVIGGAQRDGTKLSSIERAVIQPDGSLGPFAIVPGVTLATARSGHTSEVIGNTLYVIGGDAGSAVPLGDLERAVIQPDGTLGPFTAVSGVKLVTVRHSHRSVVMGSGLYVLGGTGSAGVSGSVEYAPIAADGSLAPFTPLPGIALSTPRTGLAVATIGTSLYVIGGSSGSDPLRAFERASLNADSAVGAFATSDNALVKSRNSHTTTIVRDSLYVIGRSATDNTIERASISQDGSIGSFATVPGVSLVSPRDGHTTVVIRNFLYVIGGEGPGGRLSSVERAGINPDGSLGSFAIVTGVTLNEGRFGHISVIDGDFLYVIGGFGSNDQLTSVERATINTDGTLGAFATVPGVTLNIRRNLITGFVTGPYLYIIGGNNQVDGALASVERASIGADGSLGAFAISSSSLIVPRGSHTSTVIGNSLYVMGGYTNGGHATTVEHAIINADGSLSAFSTVFGIAPVTPRAYHTTTALGNSSYIIGGDVDILDSVEHASLR